jgi:hypothetical protein
LPPCPCSVRQHTRSVGLKLTGALPCALEYLATAAPTERQIQSSNSQRALASSSPNLPELPPAEVDEEENEASPSVSRSVSLLCRSRSRSELTDAVAAACFSLSSATDAMATASGFARRRGLRGDLVGSAHGEEIPTVRVRAAPAEKEAAGGREGGGGRPGGDEEKLAKVRGTGGS